MHFKSINQPQRCEFVLVCFQRCQFYMSKKRDIETKCSINEILKLLFRFFHVDVTREDIRLTFRATKGNDEIDGMNLSINLTKYRFVKKQYKMILQKYRNIKS